MSAARDEILNRIRDAVRDVPADEPVEGWSPERAYRRSSDAPRTEVIDRFADRVAHYQATVRRVREDGLRAAVAEACLAHGRGRFAVPADLPGDWLPDAIELMRDGGNLTYRELDQSAGVITGCAVAIAETGTIVLDAGPGQGRRAITLLPDYHLCIVKADQIVALVPEAIERLATSVRGEGRPITFISGPSATSDIELNRVDGVHGPRNLEVLIVEPTSGS